VVQMEMITEILGIAFILLIIGYGGYIFVKEVLDGKYSDKYNSFDKRLKRSEKETLDKKIKQVIEKLGERNNRFEINPRTKKQLKTDYFDVDVIKTLIDEINEFLEVPFKVVVEREFTEDNKNKNSGQFSVNGYLVKIKLIMNWNSTLEQVIAIACHECTHLFLYSKKIEFKNTLENEIFTDIAAIYLGFNEYIKKGYEVTETRNSFCPEMIETSKIGYISSIEIDYIIKTLKRYRKDMNKKSTDLTRKQDNIINQTMKIQNKLKILTKKLELNYDLINISKNITSNKKIPNNDFELLQENYYLYESGELKNRIEKIKSKMENLNKEDQKEFDTYSQSLIEEIESFENELDILNNILQKIS